MSQIYKRLTSSGPFPPNIPIEFTTDDGTAIPAANNLNILARDTSDNDVDGIRTKADPNLSENVYVELTNRITGIATTTDAITPQVLYTFSLGATPGAYLVDVRLVAYNLTDAIAAGYTSFRLTKTNGITATDVSATPGFISEEAAMTGVSAVNSVSGNNILLTVTGLAGKTIHWLALTTYNMVT